MRQTVFVLLLLLAGCGSSTPTQPTPTPIPLAVLQVDMTVPLTLRDTRAGWAFRGQGVNRGLGCATRVHATASFRTPAGELVETVTSDVLPPQTILQPGQTFAFEGCCMDPDRYALHPDVTTAIVFAWDALVCPVI